MREQAATVWLAFFRQLLILAVGEGQRRLSITLEGVMLLKFIPIAPHDVIPAQPTVRTIN
jgi:hypothetical protein